jgi:hypothetical protein
LLAGGVLFALIPILNVFTTNSHLGVTLFQGKGPVAVAGFDLFVLGFGLLLIYAAKRLVPRKVALKLNANDKAIEIKPNDGDHSSLREAT